MTGLLLVSLLKLSPGIQLADSVNGHHAFLNGAHLRYVDDAPVASPGISAMTREQLIAEKTRLEENAPGIVGPIVMLGVGGGLAIAGLGFLFDGLGVLASNAGAGTVVAAAVPIVGYVLVVIAGVCLVVGAILLIVGGIKLGHRLGERRENSEARDAVQKRLDELDAHPIAPPPPPPPPPQANFVIPSQGLVLATF